MATVTEAQALDIYKNSIHFDGLNICGLWENFRDSMFNIVQWKKWFDEYPHLIMQAHTVKDIRTAKEKGVTGVILSWQNTAGIEDRYDFLRLFRDLGVRIMQLTYNTQNYSGAGYTELNDSGLTGFGREVVTEMARLGIVCDLSHVGPKTSADVIEFAPEGKPPCFSHVLPCGLKEHTRNKSDELIKAIGAKGGFVGLSQFGPHMKKGNDSTVDDYVEALDYVISLIGEDLVGIGSDSSEGHGRPSDFMAWCNKDKGYARSLTAWGHAKVIKPLGPLRERPELVKAMARAGWSETKIRKVLGENWLVYLEKIFGA